MKLSNIAKKMILTVGILALAFIAIGIAVCVYRGIPAYPFVIGTILGSAFTAVKLVMLEYAIHRALEMDQKSGGHYIRMQYLFRFLLTGLVLVLGALPSIPFISLWGVVAGIFTLQIATFCMKFFLDDEEKQEANSNTNSDANQDEKA